MLSFMDRKEFLKTCGIGCMAMVGAATLLEGCAGPKFLSANIEGSDMMLTVADFEINKKGGRQYRKYIILQNEKLQYPICVYRISEREYHALWMRCTHQGAELQVFGDRLQCPAHGSEFTHKGTVHNGPADTGLRTFPVVIDGHQLKIDLRQPTV
jgi:Rieske Fe-S protein